MTFKRNILTVFYKFDKPDWLCWTQKLFIEIIKGIIYNVAVLLATGILKKTCHEYE